MRRRVSSVALIVALAFACAGRADARAAATGGPSALGGDADQAALVPGAHRETRVSRPASGRGPAPVCLLSEGTAAPAPLLAAVEVARPAGQPAREDTSGSTRTSRGPPRAAAERF